jgi:type II secretory pathway component PulK
MNDRLKMIRRKRFGAVLAAVLMTLLAVLWIGTELTRSSVMRYRSATQAEQRQQAFWLGESAVVRARKALRESPDYEGETWNVGAEVLGSGEAGEVVITVESSTEDTGARRILVQAYYPEDAVHRTLCTREVIVNSTGDLP